MLVNDILEFNKKKYFNGAVQANWFYDNDKVYDVTSSYVFHGPKYHGVDQQETGSLNYKLNDTASYLLRIAKKSSEKESNRFNMTIAGYGTGKTHFSVAMASFLSGHNNVLRQTVIENVKTADKSIALKLQSYTGKNLVLVLNGMKDFNLNSEILSVTKKALEQHGISSEVLASLTKQYRQAISFCRNTFETYKDSYDKYLSDAGYKNILTLEDILSALENTDRGIFNVVNEVFHEFMGTYINVETDISAADVLSLIVQKYCIEQKVFDRIYILFDEFGRYIEYTANNPHIAGDSALQQIFEAIQNADGNIVFDAFIQSDLNSYIRRVQNANSNINRYIGRYENSDKYYISANFETILANLIETKNDTAFRNTVEQNIDDIYPSYHQRIFYALNAWARPQIQNRSVWTNSSMYFEVIAKGCYPIHPVTVWFLANTSSWMQQRSTIAYTAELFENIKNAEITPRWIPYIYPTDIIGTGLFDEMLSSEEKGYVQSQSCLTYQAIISKTGDKLSNISVSVLRAILIANVMQFKFDSRESCIRCICVCSGLNEDDVNTGLSSLENEFCVVSFDRNNNCFDLNAEAHGYREYMLCLSKRIILARTFDPISEMDEELMNELRLNIPENTSFSNERNISSSEWQYEKSIIKISDFNESYCRSLLNYFKSAVDAEKLRGKIIYIYAGKDWEKSLSYMVSATKNTDIDKYPVFFFILKDDNENWLSLLRKRAAYRKFTESEKEMYSRFITKDQKILMRSICSDYNNMVKAKLLLTKNGIMELNEKICPACLDKFKSIYPNAIPFSFAEFEKKPSPAAKKKLLALCRSMYSGVMCNKQSYQGLDPTDKRRIQTIFSTTSVNTSWQIFNTDYELCEPQNKAVKNIYDITVNKITADKKQTIAQLYLPLLDPPYGLNHYSLFLFIVYILTYHSKRLLIYNGNHILSKKEFTEQYLSSEKKMLENLFKLKISLKEQDDDEALEELIKDIKQLKYTEKCEELKKSLNDLCEKSDNKDSLKGKIADCEYRLNQGIRLNNSLYQTISKADKIIESCKNSFELAGIISVLSAVKLPNADTPIEEYSEFLFSPTYCSKTEQILNYAELLLKKNFKDYVSKLKCSYSQSSEFKKRYTQIVKKLSEMGKKELAETLKAKINSVLQEAETEHKYASVIAEADSFISSCNSTVSNMDHEMLQIRLSALNGWADTFSKADDLNPSVQKEYLSRLNGISKKIHLQQKALDDYITDVLKQIKRPDIDSAALLERIKKALNAKPEEKIRIKLSESAQLLEEYHSVKTKMLNADLRTISELEIEYDAKWKNTVCAGYVSECIESSKNKIQRMRTKWIEKNVTDVLSNIDSLSVTQCIQWQKIVSEVPEYLTESDLNLISSLSVKIAEIIKSQRINGVVEMFNTLTDEEKSECLHILIGRQS